MLKKTLLATATAGMVATAALAAGTTTATAGNASHAGYGSNQADIVLVGHRGHRHGGKVCHVTTKRIKVWDRHGRAYWKRVKVKDCVRGGGKKRHHAKKKHHGHKKHGHVYGGFYGPHGGYGYGYGGHGGGYYSPYGPYTFGSHGGYGSFGFNFGW